jgi:trimethylamine--corrinoid protein Co-methyltransferase
MTLRTPRIPDLLTRADVREMHNGALKILAEVGLEVEGEELVRRLTAQDGVTVRSGRVCLAPSLVEAHVEAYRKTCLAREKPTPRRRIHLSAGCCANHIPDRRTGKPRPITTEDLIQSTKLIDALHDEDVSGHVPGFPQDVPPPLQALAEYRIGSQHTRWGGSFTAPCPIEGLEYIYEMHQVMEQPFHLSLYVINPLKIVGDSLHAILHFLDRAAGFSSGSMPLMGGTAPIHFVGAFVQAMAEEMGGFVVLRLLAPGKPAGFGVMAFCLDMKYGGITYGSPEQNLCDLIRIPVNAFYGMRNVSTRSIRTMAKRPGSQAAAEKAASAVVGALAGSRSFMGAGTLSVDEVFSPEQLIIDREIADYAQRVADGFEYDPDKLSLDIIAECAGRGEFLAHPSTLANHRRIYWMPTLFEHMSLRRWQQLGEPQLVAEAGHIVDQKLARYDFELAPEKRRELDRIYQLASETLV